MLELNQVCFEPLWEKKDGPKKRDESRRKLYQHATTNAGIWKLNLFSTVYMSNSSSDGTCGSKTAILAPKIATAATDGTVRICDIPTNVLSKKGNPALGSSVAQLFRMHRVHDEGVVHGDSCPGAVGRGAVVFFSSSSFLCSYETDPEIRISLPTVSLYDIDSYDPYVENLMTGRDNDVAVECTEQEADTPKSHSKHAKRVFAYGGSAGLIRVHTVDMPWAL